MLWWCIICSQCLALFSPETNFGDIMTCVNGDEGNQLMHQNAKKTKALQPPHKFVPWVNINGVRNITYKNTNSVFNQSLYLLHHNYYLYVYRSTVMICRRKQWAHSSYSSAVCTRWGFVWVGVWVGVTESTMVRAKDRLGESEKERETKRQKAERDGHWAKCIDKGGHR